MNVTGVGIDIVSVARIEKVDRRYGNAFAARILSEREFREFETLFNRPVKPPARQLANRWAWLAKRFAAKEAVAKALGTGFSGGVYLNCITILHEAGGKPYVKLEKAAGDRLNGRWTQIHISIADERDYAIAYAVISTANRP